MMGAVDKSLLKTLSKAAGDAIIEKTMSSGRDEDVSLSKREEMFKQELEEAKRSSFYKGVGLGLVGSLGVVALVGLLSSVGSYIMSFMFLVMLVAGGWFGVKKLTEKRREERELPPQAQAEALRKVVEDPVAEAKATTQDLEAQLAALKDKAGKG